MKREKISSGQRDDKTWTKVFYTVFAWCFTAVVLSAAICAGNRSAAELPLTALGLPCCLCLLWALNHALDRCAEWLERRYYAILGVFAAGMFLAEYLLALQLRHGVWFDVEAIFSGAIEWVETGSFSTYYQYFGYFPNNLGGLTFLYGFFKTASFLGWTDYYAVSAMAASAMLSAAMALVSLICKRLADAKCGVLALLVFLLSPQFWFLGGAVYTDVLSMLFPILFFYLYLRYQDSTGSRRYLFLSAMGLTMAVGSEIKCTVLIMAVAVLLHALLRRGLVRALELGVWVLGITAAVSLTLNAFLYTTQLSREEARENNTPLLHWVLMGLQGDGLYNSQDYEFTRSLPAEGRNAALWQEIRNRVREKGLVGMVEHILRKSAIDFGDGTYGADDFLKIQPYEDTRLHQIVLQDGAFHNWYRGYTTAMHLAILVYMVLGARQLATGLRSKQDELRFPMYLAVFGLWVFLMAWETNRRYFSNFAPVIIACGVLAVPSGGKGNGTGRNDRREKSAS